MPQSKKISKVALHILGILESGVNVLISKLMEYSAGFEFSDFNVPF